MFISSFPLYWKWLSINSNRLNIFFAIAQYHISEDIGSLSNNYACFLLLNRMEYFVASDLVRSNYYGPTNLMDLVNWCFPWNRKCFESNAFLVQSTRIEPIQHFSHPIPEESTWSEYKARVYKRSQTHFLAQMNFSDWSHIVIIAVWDKAKDWKDYNTPKIIHLRTKSMLF